MRAVPAALLVLLLLGMSTAPLTSTVPLNDEPQVRGSTSSDAGDWVLDEMIALNSTDEVVVRSLATDSNHGLVSCVVFQGFLDVSGTGATLQSYGGWDVALVGQHANGSVWVEHFDGIGNDDCDDVAFTSTGSVAFVGSHNGRLILGGQTHDPVGMDDLFFGVHNPDDRTTSGGVLGSSGMEAGATVLPLSNGTLLVGGMTMADAADLQADNDACDGSVCGLLAWTSLSGAVDAVHFVGGSSNTAVADLKEIGTSGRVLVTGSFFGTLSLNSATAVDITKTSEGMSDWYIGKLETDGRWMSLQAFGGPLHDVPFGMDVRGGTMAIAGEVTTSGTSPFSINGTSSWETLGGGYGGRDIVVLRGTSSGVLTGGTHVGTAEWDRPYDVSLNSTGALMFAGFSEGAWIDPSTGTERGHNQSRFALLVHGDRVQSQAMNAPEWNVSHVWMAGGSSGSTSSLTAIKHITDDDMVVAGHLSLAPDQATWFGQGLGGSGSNSAFIARMGVDADGDGISNRLDVCPSVDDPLQSNHDGDSSGDACDADDDNDGVDDLDDRCPRGSLVLSTPSSDHDNDGCEDATEDEDDDDDGRLDLNDGCSKGEVGWDSSNQSLDRDQDGCVDAIEDEDADNDGVMDNVDTCAGPSSLLGGSGLTDLDGDGCFDEEDPDVDGDGVLNEADGCDLGLLGWTSTATLDHDGDGCHDVEEDLDDDQDGVFDLNDACNRSTPPRFAEAGFDDHDGDGCHDDEDDDNDNDGRLNDADACPTGFLGWSSNGSLDDVDQDGCHDGEEDTDDDDDGVKDGPDLCDPDSSTVWEQGWQSTSLTDHDGDGCRDGTDEENDDDNDGVPNMADACRRGMLGIRVDFDGNGCADVEDPDIDGDGVPNADDQRCPTSPVGSNDFDLDGCADGEDDDIDDDGVPNALDRDPLMDVACDRSSPPGGAIADTDGDGCHDLEELDVDGDGVNDDGDDLCNLTSDFIEGFISTPANDRDNDGCKDDGPKNNDFGQDTDDDNDGILDIDDRCPKSDAALVREGADRDGDGCFDAEDRDSYALALDDRIEVVALILLAVLMTFVVSAGRIGKGLSGFRGIFAIGTQGGEFDYDEGSINIGDVDGDLQIQQGGAGSDQPRPAIAPSAVAQAAGGDASEAGEVGTLLSRRVHPSDDLRDIEAMLAEEPRLQLRARQVVTESLRHVARVDNIPSLLEEGHEIHLVHRTEEPFQLMIHTSWFDHATETFHLIDAEVPCRVVDHAAMLAFAVRKEHHDLWASELGEHLAERIHHLEVEAETPVVMRALDSMLSRCGVRMHDPHPSMVTAQIITCEELRRHPAFVEEQIVKMQKAAQSGVYGTLVLKMGSSAQECVVLDALSAAQGSTGVVFAERSKVVKMASEGLEVANLATRRAGEALKSILKGR